jgi:hypothetical protein
VRAAKQEVAARDAEARAIGPGAHRGRRASYFADGKGGEPGVREAELALAPLDVAGLVGAGRSGAARARAHAQVALARAEPAAAHRRRAARCSARRRSSEGRARVGRRDRGASRRRRAVARADRAVRTRGRLAPGDVAMARPWRTTSKGARRALEAAAGARGPSS